MNDREALEKLRQDGRQRAGAVQYLYRRYAVRFLAYFLRHRLTVRRAEAFDGAPRLTAANAESLRSALEQAGVEFIPENGGGPGVRRPCRSRCEVRRQG